MTFKSLNNLSPFLFLSNQFWPYSAKSFEILETIFKF